MRFACFFFNQSTRNLTLEYGVTMGEWYTGLVTNMANLFEGLVSFDEPIGDWDVWQSENHGVHV